MATPIQVDSKFTATLPAGTYDIWKISGGAMTLGRGDSAPTDPIKELKITEQAQRITINTGDTGYFYGSGYAGYYEIV